MNDRHIHVGSTTGMSLSSTLLVIFICLKLLGVIDWSWFWVLSPLWISFLVFLIIVLIIVLIEVRPIKRIKKFYGIGKEKRR